MDLCFSFKCTKGTTKHNRMRSRGGNEQGKTHQNYRLPSYITENYILTCSPNQTNTTNTSSNSNSKERSVSASSAYSIPANFNPVAFFDGLVALKNAGNRQYQHYKFNQAIVCYSKALAHFNLTERKKDQIPAPDSTPSSSRNIQNTMDKTKHQKMKQISDNGGNYIIIMIIVIIIVIIIIIII